MAASSLRFKPAAASTSTTRAPVAGSSVPRWRNWARVAGSSWLLAAVTFTVHAENPAFSATQLDFELAASQGFVRLADLPPQVSIVNFWRSDCPPCVRELPLLATAAARQANRPRVVAVALQRVQDTARAAPEVQHALRPPLLLLHGPSEPRGLLARFGNRSGALPYTLVLTPDRRPCASHSGEISEPWLNQAIARCQSA